MNIMVNEEDRTVTAYVSVVKAIYTHIFFSSFFWFFLYPCFSTLLAKFNLIIHEIG